MEGGNLNKNPGKEKEEKDKLDGAINSFRLGQNEFMDNHALVNSIYDFFDSSQSEEACINNAKDFIKVMFIIKEKESGKETALLDDPFSENKMNHNETLQNRVTEYIDRFGFEQTKKAVEDFILMKQADINMRGGNYNLN